MASGRWANTANSWFDDVDGTTVVRGASAGLTILFLGGFAAPLMQRLAGLGPLSMIACAVAAFAVAGTKNRHATHPGRQGGLAAVGSYLMMFPVVLMSGPSVNLLAFAATAALAIVVGVGSAVLSSGQVTLSQAGAFVRGLRGAPVAELRSRG